MPRLPGHDPGHAPAGLSWGDYVDWLVSVAGTLAQVAERLASLRGFKEDVGSIERALRRLRARGQESGGVWGARAMSAFGLPEAAHERARWMGAYHSRFNDLPLPLCVDLVRLWDRPPVSEAPFARVWLALAHASCSLRAGDLEAAAEHVARARASMGNAPPEARVEILLVDAFIASRDDPSRVPSLLADVEPLLATGVATAMSDADRACLYARWVDQRAYEANRSRPGKSPDPALAEALYLSIDEAHAPPFALCRRANGLAYARWKQGFAEEGAALALRACSYAGDGGHMRLRAMALTMFARIRGGEEGERARERAMAIAKSLDDEALRLRFERGLTYASADRAKKEKG